MWKCCGCHQSRWLIIAALILTKLSAAETSVVAPLPVVTHRPEFVLELVGTAAGGTQRGVQAGEVLVVAHLDEAGHSLRREADEVQVSCPAAHGQVPQLQVDVADARLTWGDRTTPWRQLAAVGTSSVWGQLSHQSGTSDAGALYQVQTGVFKQ